MLAPRPYEAAGKKTTKEESVRDHLRGARHARIPAPPPSKIMPGKLRGSPISRIAPAMASAIHYKRPRL